ncbi:MAG TPA: F0F1 ATP synthase subunit A [bacterium]|nr:F0F1 ATP synthase subunit A [bacterium]
MHGVSIYGILGVPERYIPVAGSLLVFLITAIIAIIIRLEYKKPSAHIPSPKLSVTNAIEAVIEAMDDFLESILGEHTKGHLPFLLSTFLYILIANLSGMIPGLIPASGSASINAAMAAFVFCYYNFIGLKKHGFYYFKIFAGPVIWLVFLMVPIEIMTHLARPLSLTLRLAGNMGGEHLVMSIISGLVPWGVPVIFMFLSLITDVIQAVVFTALSAIYILLSTDIDH